jgi:predicted RNase H-like HicB family nuclease
MSGQYTAVIKQEYGWWVGWIEEVSGVSCQERTREKLVETLRAALREAIALNREDALWAARSGYVEEPIGA